ncbi:hypothetical protein [Microcoleus sp.]|uniref:hypothetical protein n=1 Tax=Microcoleus sp. TaxID=44472 RepID=UPI003524BE02
MVNYSRLLLVKPALTATFPGNQGIYRWVGAGLIDGRLFTIIIGETRPYSDISWKPVLPITNYQLPITNYQLPITHYQLPITHYPLPIINYQLLIASNTTSLLL